MKSRGGSLLKAVCLKRVGKKWESEQEYSKSWQIDSDPQFYTLVWMVTNLRNLVNRDPKRSEIKVTYTGAVVPLITLCARIWNKKVWLTLKGPKPMLVQIWLMSSQNKVLFWKFGNLSFKNSINDGLHNCPSPSNPTCDWVLEKADRQGPLQATCCSSHSLALAHITNWLVLFLAEARGNLRILLSTAPGSHHHQPFEVGIQMCYSESLSRYPFKRGWKMDFIHYYLKKKALEKIYSSI